MRIGQNSQFRWAVVGVGALGLLIGVSLSLWVFGGSDGIGTGGSGPLESPTEEAAKDADTGLNAAESPSTDTATLSESVEVEVKRAQASPTAPAGSGPGDSARLSESVEYVVRDSSGKVKERGVIE